MLLLALYLLQELPSVPPDHQWIPNAALSLFGTLLLTLLGALWRSEQKKKHLELMHQLRVLEDRIFEKADQRYVRKPDVEPHIRRHPRPAHGEI